MNLFDNILSGYKNSYLGSGQLGSDIYDFMNKPKIPKDTTLTPQDMQFVQQAMDKGASQEEAFDLVTEFKYNQQQAKKQSSMEQSRQGFLGTVGGSIQDVVGGAIEQVPRTLGNVGEFLSKAGGYTPPALIGTAIKAGLSDKTFGQIREEQKKEAEKLGQIGEAGSQFVKQYGAYNPESMSAGAGRLGVEIGSSLIGPNKIGTIKSLGKFARPTQIAMEGGLAGAKYDIASKGQITPESVAIGAGGNLALAGAFKGGQKLAQIVKPKTAQQKILESVGQETKGIVQGRKVKVPVPEKTFLEKVTFGVGRNKDAKVLAGRALTPSYAGKTPKQMLKTVGDIEKNIKEFYSQVRTGKMKGNIGTLEEGANTVISNLDEIGAKIGGAVETAKGKTALSMGTRSEMKKVLTNKVEKRAGAYGALKNFYEDTAKGLSLKDAFKAKKIYQAEVTKLIKAGDAGTDSYQSLVKGLQELSDNIDTAVEKSIGTKEFLQWKKQYKLLKSIASDISKSAVVEGRRSPNTFVEQLGTLEAIKEGITSPLSTAGKLYAKEIGELNTRGGAWKELIKLYDQEAIDLAKKIKPKKIKVGG